MGFYHTMLSADGNVTQPENVSLVKTNETL
jgi:hypothetical protein